MKTIGMSLSACRHTPLQVEAAQIGKPHIQQQAARAIRTRTLQELLSRGEGLDIQPGRSGEPRESARTEGSSSTTKTMAWADGISDFLDGEGERRAWTVVGREPTAGRRAVQQSCG